MPQEVASVVSKGAGLMGRPMFTEDMVKLGMEDFVPSMTREEYEGQRVEGKVSWWRIFATHTHRLSLSHCITRYIFT